MWSYCPTLLLVEGVVGVERERGVIVLPFCELRV